MTWGKTQSAKRKTQNTKQYTAMSEEAHGESWAASPCMRFRTKTTCTNNGQATCKFDNRHKVCFPSQLSRRLRGTLTRLIRGERQEVQRYLQQAKKLTIDQWLALGCWQTTDKQTCNARKSCSFNTRHQLCLPKDAQRHAGYLRNSEQLQQYVKQASHEEHTFSIHGLLRLAAPLRFRILGALGREESWKVIGIHSEIAGLLQHTMRSKTLSNDFWWGTFEHVSKSVWSLTQRYEVLGVSKLFQHQAHILRSATQGSFGAALAKHLASIQQDNLSDTTAMDVQGFVRSCLVAFHNLTYRRAMAFHRQCKFWGKVKASAQRDGEQATITVGDPMTPPDDKHEAELLLAQSHAAVRTSQRRLAILARSFAKPLLNTALVFGMTTSVATAMHSTGYANVMVLVVQVLFGCVMDAARQITKREASAMKWFLAAMDRPVVEATLHMFDNSLTHKSL